MEAISGMILFALLVLFLLVFVWTSFANNIYKVVFKKGEKEHVFYLSCRNRKEVIDVVLNVEPDAKIISIEEEL